MTDEPFEDWTPEQRDRLRSLPRQRIPPPALEDRVVEALRGQGLLGPRKLGARRWLQVATALAAAFACFLLGWAAAPRSSSRAGAMPEGKRFVLFLYEGKGFDQGPPSKRQERIREYGAWARHAGQSGAVLGGEKLEEGGRLLLPDGQRPQSEPLPPSGSETLAGYFVIQALSYQQAVDLARTCPHLRHGGSIEVRQIEPT